ncbi:MAG: hypothetical protein KatS3mg126_0407 [Lysobacteraceae bacterium]|nr:MAG: hypothetical protein KatS3mg126_0407 [Xanthomonadaceae bacterium]
MAEVASVGGFRAPVPVTVDPRACAAYGIPLARVSQVDPRANRDVGGRVVEMAETEYMVRGRGYLRGVEDIENLVLKARGRRAGAACGDVARRRAGAGRAPRPRRAERRGRVVAGIAVARYGQNALE